MSIPRDEPPAQAPPQWALDQAESELSGTDSRSSVTPRAWQLVREVQEQRDEQHDEYDDPDEGGEA